LESSVERERNGGVDKGWWKWGREVEVKSIPWHGLSNINN
jgi:hypothetical protein